MPQEAVGLQALKRKIRGQAEDNRRRQANTDELSRTICGRLTALPEYEAARSVMFYVDFRNEVRTRPLLRKALDGKPRVVVPYCVADDLHLFRLERMDELAAGTWSILEPRVELRALTEKKVDVGELDLIVVPGVAFDRRGARLGHGRGYYDRLLAGARPETRFVALAYECQIFPEVPMGPQDVAMHAVITEQAVYLARS